MSPPLSGKYLSYGFAFAQCPQGNNVMLRKFLFTLLFVVALAGAVNAANIDLATIANPDSVPSPTTENTYLYSSTDDIIAGLEGKAIEVGSNVLTIGRSSANAGTGFDLTLGGITTIDGSSTVTVIPANSGDVIVRSSLNMNNGGAANFGGNAGTVAFYGATLAADGFAAATLNINGNSTVTFTEVANNRLGGANTATVNLNGGQLWLGSSANELTLANGSINVKQNSQLGVKDTLIINNETSAASASLNIDAGKQLTLVTELGNASSLASLTIGGTAAGGGTLRMGDASSTLTVKALTLAEGAKFYGGDAGNINANSLVVSGTFQDEENVKTTVTGLAEIEDGAVYIVAGEDNVYSGGMTVHGTLKGDASPTTITLGKSVDERKDLTIDGGSVSAGAGGLTIDYARINIKNASAVGDTTIDASEGRLNLDTSIIEVNLSGDPTATIKADKGISVAGYYQHTGNVNISTVDGNNKMVVKETATIGSDLATSQVNLDVSGRAVQFAGGLILNEYGAVTAVNATGAVDIGTASGNAAILSKGNNQLLAAQGLSLTFNNMSNAAGTMTWQGLNNSVIGEIDQSQFNVAVGAGAELEVGNYSSNDPGYQVGALNVYGRLGMIQDSRGASASVITSSGNVVVKDGGILTADYAPSVDAYAYIVNAGSSANVLRVDKGGALNPNTSTIYAENFKSVEINGNFVAGLLDDSTDPVEAARLMANSDVNISAAGLVTLSADLAKVVTAADDADDATKLIQVEGGHKITNKANMSSKSMLGKFGYALTSDETILYVKTVDGRVVLDDTEEDRRQAWENLKDLWCKNQFNYDLSNVIYDSLLGAAIVEPEDSVAGNKNMNLLEAIAVPEGKVVGFDTLEYVNGAHLYGVTDVAIQTNRTFMSDVTMRAKAMSCQFVADAGNAAGSSDALATTAMNVYKLNRFWFGGSALRQYADKRDCFSGYKYKAHGFSGGLDRVAWENVAIGGAFAFNRGDYEDEGAAAHDSKIESFTAGGYVTYSSPCNGWFVTGHGAYTYSQNDIRELRNDPDAARLSWAESSFHTKTWSFGGLFGYDFRLVEHGFALTPSIGFNYITAADSDHDSKLDGVATQRVTDAKNAHVYMPVDFTVQYERCLGPNSSMRLEGNVGYAYNFRQSGMTGDITLYDLDPLASYGIHGRNNSRHTYKVGFGGRYRYREFDIGVRYDFAGMEGYRGHRLMASAGLSF